MQIELMGVPLDYGAGRRGVDMGPSAIRCTGLQPSLTGLGHSVVDSGDLPVPVPESLPRAAEVLPYVDTIMEVNVHLAEWVAAALDAARFPLILGGDHSISMGSAMGLLRGGRRFGMLWIDAHADFNDEFSSPTGNVHGMALASILGLGPTAVRCRWPPVAAFDPNKVALIGLQSVDPGERQPLLESGANIYTMSEIDRHGLAAVIEKALRLVSTGTDGLHLSLDIDVIDPMVAPGVGTPCPGGLTYREAHLLMELVAETGRLISMEVVEVNPVLDCGNRTARLARSLILSALGSRIL